MWLSPFKGNYVEKTEYPCQFPVELIERLVLSMTNEGDWVFDPFLGTGTTIVAAIRHNRRGAGAEVVPRYLKIAHNRIQKELAGSLRTRPLNKPVYDPQLAGNKLIVPPWPAEKSKVQLAMLEKANKRQRYRIK